MALDFSKSYPVIQWNLNNNTLFKHYHGSVDDSGNGFKLQIVQDSEILTPSSEMAYFYFKKKDNTDGYIHSTISDNYFVFDLTNQVYAVKGEVECNFQITNGTKWRTSKTFNINVDDNNIANAIESSNDFIAFQNALNTLGDLTEEVNTATANAIVATDNTNSATQDARTEITNMVNLETSVSNAESDRVSKENTRINNENARNLYEVYNPSKPYVVNNKVTLQYNGTYSSYKNIVPCQGVSPSYNTDNANWICISSSGGNIANAAQLPIIDTGNYYTTDDANSALQEIAKRVNNLVISVKDFGAIGDGIIDDTMAIQNAVNYVGTHGGGIVWFPAGKYLVSSTIKVLNPNVYLYGAGRWVSMIVRSLAAFTTDYDTVLFNLSGAHGCGMFHMFIGQKINEMTSGSHLRVLDCQDGLFEDLHIDAGYDCLTLEASARIDFRNIWCSHTVGLNGNSYYTVKYNENTSVKMVVSCKFSQCDALPLREGYPVNVGYHILCSDGLWFSDCHVQGTNYALVLDGANKNIGNYFNNCYFDDNKLRAVTILGTGTTFGGFKFNNCEIRTGVIGIDISANVSEVSFNSCTIELTQAQAVSLNSNFSNISFIGNKFKNNNTLNSTGVYDIVIGSISAGATNLQFDENIFTSGTLRNGGVIEIYSGSFDNISILNNNMLGFQSSDKFILNHGSTGDIVYLNNLGNIATAIASAATITPSTGEVFHITGTTAITNISIKPSGYKITMIFDGTLTVNNTGNIKLASNFSATPNSTLTLVSDGTNWYKV